MNCDNCGSTIGLRKGIVGDGRPLQKGNRRCPECGETVRVNSPRTLSK